VQSKYDPSKVENRIYQMWENAQAFKAGANAKPNSEPFCIMIPPPNVTGALHMGHAFNNTIQDILIRWHRMRGYDVLWQPGQDHAGIATQMVVERDLEESGQPSRKELGREKFLEKIWQWKEQSGDKIINQLKRLGASCDWSRNRFTMDQGFHDAVLKVFVELYHQGYIYKGQRLVNWDPKFESAISDLEVEQVEVNGRMWYFRYPLAEGKIYQHPTAFDDEGKPLQFEKRDYLVVATTRPETILGDTAVAVHPDDARYSHLINAEVILPLVNRRIKIVADTYADPTKGSGAVKITPGHDFNDWEVGQRAKLKAINVMTSQARMRLQDNKEFLENCHVHPEILELDGLDRYEARKKIVEMMQAKGLLDCIEEERHMVPHGDRSKVPIEPFLTDQWFVDTRKIVSSAIEAVKNGQTQIHPQQYQKIYFNWLENIEPWCISRQLWWGHQIPVWYDSEGNQYCATSEQEAHIMAKGKPLIRDPDVLDTWFSSGLWPIGTLGWPKETPELKRYFPTNVLVTGFDIIFFWVARMMMMQLTLVNQAPFKDVYVHALVRDKYGKKMSKSLGNVIDPIDLIDKFGADAVRFTLTSMAVMGRDLRLSESRVQGYRNFCSKIWNAARFAQLNHCQIFAEFVDPDSESLGRLENAKKPQVKLDFTKITHTINRWIIGETAATRETVDIALGEFRFNHAANTLYSFVWGTFCDWYLEFAKSLLNASDIQLVNESKTVLAWTLDQILLMLHPTIPFITEEIWQEINPDQGLLIHCDWPDYCLRDYSCPKATEEVQYIINLISTIRSIRSQMRVPPSAFIPVHIHAIDPSRHGIWIKNDDEICRLARIESPSTGEGSTQNSVTLTILSDVIYLALGDFIDLAAERERIKQSLAKLEKEIGKLSSQLNNPDFIAKAPPEIVKESQSKLDGMRFESQSLEEAISRINL